MKNALILGTVVLTGLAAAPAVAGQDALSHRLTLKASTALLADNVVVTPGNGGGSAGTPTQNNVQAAPAQPAAAQAAPQQTAVVDTPRSNKVVHADVDENHNYMGTIAVSALMGGLVGVLVGGSIYFLGDQENARNIAYWGAGGVLLGAGVGVVQVVVQENRVSNATALNKLPSDPAPTMRLALFRTSF